MASNYRTAKTKAQALKIAKNMGPTAVITKRPDVFNHLGHRIVGSYVIELAK